MDQQIFVEITIPDDLTFSDLRLAREKNGNVSFDWEVIERICEASGLPVNLFCDELDENVTGLILSWYQVHIQSGGERDPVQDDLIAEVIAEEEAGQKFSLQPGQA